MNQTVPLLDIQNLGKVYPNGTRALRGVSFKVFPGEFLVVIGLSGSGKSTLLRCLNQLIPISEGRIFFEGHEVTHLDPRGQKQLRQKMGMIFQHFNLVERHSVLRNVLMGSLSRTNAIRSILGLFPKAELDRAFRYLNLVGISEKAYLRAGELSGGQQQRIAIARALTQNPKVLLADEPVASLDPATCHIVLDYLQKINRELGLTVICNLHFLSLVRQYATRVLALRAGELVYEGHPSNIDEAWFKKIYGEDAREVHVR